MPDITLVTQSLSTEILSLPEEFQVVTINAPVTVVDVQETPVIIVDVTPSLVVDISQTNQVIDISMSQQVVVVDTGPLVIPYVPEVKVAQDVQIDEASPTVTYVGEASPGTASSQALWRIKRITDSGGQVSIDWAGGVGTYVHVWNDRANLVYGP
jgi:hypothetical protein